MAYSRGELLTIIIDISLGALYPLWPFQFTIFYLLLAICAEFSTKSDGSAEQK
jgi:hypothetical protein